MRYSFKHNKNGLTDYVEVRDGSGNLVAAFSYDEWGGPVGAMEAATMFDPTADELSAAHDFIKMVLDSVEGGGYLVTFNDDDIAEMKRLLTRE